MEYNELITKARQAPIDAPDTDVILGGMRRTLRRRQQRQTVFVVVMLLGVSAMTLPLLSVPAEPEPTLAERVSRQFNTPPADIPAPVLGYQHSIHQRQIFTMI